MSDQLECTRLARSKPSWPILRLKHIARLTGGGTPAKENATFWTDGDVPWVSPKDMKRSVITETEDYITRAAVDGSATSYVEAGSPLVVVRSGILRHTLPVAIAGCRLTLNQDMKAFRLSERLNKQFFAYWIEGQSSDLLLEWRQFGATVESIDTFRMMNGRLAVPDLDTQKAIVDFLDRETARIDQLIEKKERQLEFLAERARATVFHVVTKGLNATAPTVSSGLDWLPVIPSLWKVMRIANLFREVNDPGTDGPPVLSVSIHHGISDRELDDDERERKAVRIEDRTSYKRVRPGYLAYNMMRAWQGAVGVSTVDGLVSPAYVVAKPIFGQHTPYFQYLLRTPCFVEEMRRRSKGITSFRLRLYWEHFRHMKVVLPPLTEQQAIADAAKRFEKRAENIIERVQRSIDLLRERRSALITAAVTGQIAVGTRAKIVANTKADRHRFRVIVGAEIIDRHQGAKRFGRVKLQKLLFLAETHADIPELGGVYLREAAGPLDRDLLAEAERGMSLEGFYQPNTQEDDLTTGVSYKPLANVGRHRQELTSLLGGRETELTRIINLLKQFETKAVEAITTIYAAWNDALLDGAKSDDAAIIKSVLKDWHPEKAKKFKEADLRHWLDWMRRNGLVPIGRGPKTTTGRFFP